MLSVSIYSFGFQRSGIPADSGLHRGGFVFDCRCLPNPGREEAYQFLTGLDPAVQQWLNDRPEVQRFGDTCSLVIEQSIEAYLARNFEHLMISYGCTGGQHRSVYLSEQLRRRLSSRENLKVSLTHIERPYWPQP